MKPVINENNNKKILLIEDDDLIRDLYTRVLKTQGYAISEASDGEEGLTAMIEGGYDLVLLDIMLPKISGIDILKKIKETPAKQPNGKVVMLTNLDQDSYIDTSLSEGASAYLIKDQSPPDVLIQEVKKNLA